MILIGPVEEPPPVGVRHLPRLCRHALSIAWTAGRGDLILSTGLQVAAGFGLAGLLLIGRSALESVLDAINGGGSLSDVLPWVLGMSAVAAVQSLSGALQRERQQILGELVSRYIEVGSWTSRWLSTWRCSTIPSSTTGCSACR